MNISKITESLKGHDQRFPPVEKWNPELCDGHEFLIDREGNWFYDGSAIKNIKLINLFASVLKKEGNSYYLVTPIEKIIVKTDLAPYKIIDFEISINLGSGLSALSELSILNNCIPPTLKKGSKINPNDKIPSPPSIPVGKPSYRSN